MQKLFEREIQLVVVVLLNTCLRLLINVIGVPQSQFIVRSAIHLPDQGSGLIITVSTTSGTRSSVKTHIKFKVT